MIEKMELAWIVVADIQQAVQYYTEVIGLKLLEFNKDYGWAELSGHQGGAMLGIAQASDKESVLPGQNAVMTMSVKDIEATKSTLSEKGVTFVGNIIEIPGMIKLQLFTDIDGNKFQLAQTLN